MFSEGNTAPRTHVEARNEAKESEIVFSLDVGFFLPLMTDFSLLLLP